MSSHYLVLSSASSDNLYPVWKESPSQLRVVPGTYDRAILIRGKAHVQDKNSLITPLGVSTRVSAEDLAFLRQQSHFVNAEAKGFFVVMEAAAEPERPRQLEDISDVNAHRASGADKGAQDTAQTLERSNLKKPKKVNGGQA